MILIGVRDWRNSGEPEPGKPTPMAWGALAISADGRFVASGGNSGGSVLVWDVEKMRTKQPTKHAPLSREGASDSEKHAFLVAVLKEALSTVTDRMFKHAGILTLILGWVISSDKAREFLGSGLHIRFICSFLLLFYTALFALWTDAWRRRSQAAFHHLIELRYMPIEFYSPFRIHVGLAASFISIHCAICFAIIAFYFSIR